MTQAGAARRGLIALLLAGSLVAAPSAGAADEGLRLLWLQDGRLQGELLLHADSRRALKGGELTAQRTPLGSVWKLFVHAFLLDSGAPAPDYVCSHGGGEEVYCCGPGQRIDRDAALLKSCGAFFAPSRLQIDAQSWRSYWQRLQAPAWLLDLSKLAPQTEVPVGELLAVLDRLPTREAQQRLLSASVIDAPPPVFDALGSRLRVKTWSWHRGEDRAARIGGFAGWLSDGSPLWAQGAGTSRSVLERHARSLAAALPEPSARIAAADASQDCVLVPMFARYPLRSVRARGSHQATPAGALRGEFELRFASGSEFSIRSAGELSLAYTDAGPQILGRFTREDYVARVLEREAATEPLAAARALALVARSYLQQNAEREGHCLRIEDSSARQRVLARPPSSAARAVAAFSEGLVLSGSAVGYHLDEAGPNRLVWRDAEQAARAGAGTFALLQQAFPRASLAAWDSPRAQCQPLPEARAWLLARLPRWRPQLRAEVGYEEVEDFEVCRLQSGRPFVDRISRRIHVRGLRSLQDRLDLTHEYLHLGFEAHPHGQDEDFIETRTRRLELE
jgi:uncharacterized protein YfaQ (DUF2300 family)